MSSFYRILKKHDKRTALTASTGFQSFVRSTLSAVSTDGNITTWTFYNTSLPHVLLASLTDTLLPCALLLLLSWLLLTGQHLAKSGRLRLPHLHLNSLQAHPPVVQASLLRTVLGEDATGGQGRVSALPVEGGIASRQG
jgi:hypothetical protein